MRSLLMKWTPMPTAWYSPSCCLVSLQPVISRDYRGDVDLSVINHFLPMLLSLEEEGTLSPILVHEKVTFVFIKHNNLYRIPPSLLSRQ